MATDLFTLAGTIAIDATVADQTIKGTMALVGNLTGVMQDAGTQADKTSQHFGKQSKSTVAMLWATRMYERLGQMIFNFGKEIITSGIDFNSSMEQYAAAFQTLLGVDLPTAEAFVERLRLFAQDTPLAMEGIASNAVALLNAGFDSDGVIDTLSFLGDVALGDQNKLDSIIRAYTQVKSFRKLRAQEAYQFLDADVPLYSILAEYLKVDQDQIAELQKNGDITFDVLDAALRAASADEGMYYRAMENHMGTYAGMTEKMHDMISQTLGNLTGPLFEELKNTVFPKLTASLEAFNAWISENEDSLASFAEAIGSFVSGGFDKLIDGFKWLTENQEAVSTGITVICGALIAGLTKAHPYLTALVGAMELLRLFDQRDKMAEQEKQENPGKTFKQYTDDYYENNPYGDEDYAKLQGYLTAKQMYEAALASGVDDGLTETLKARMEAARKAANPFGDNPFAPQILEDYEKWAAQTEHNPLNVMVGVDSASEALMQSNLDLMTLFATVQLNPDASALYATLAAISRGDYSGQPSDTPDGTHAKGLDFVPRDGYLARLHYGEAVLNRSTADMLRSGEYGNTGRLEAAIGRLEGLLQTVVNNTGAGQVIALDSGVLVGQLAPMMDKRLGTIANRRVRG